MRRKKVETHGAVRMAELGKTQIQIWLNAEWIAKVDAVCKRRNQKRTDLVLEALRFYFDNVMFHGRT